MGSVIGNHHIVCRIFALSVKDPCDRGSITDLLNIGRVFWFGKCGDVFFPVKNLDHNRKSEGVRLVSCKNTRVAENGLTFLVTQAKKRQKMGVGQDVFDQEKSVSLWGVLSHRKRLRLTEITVCSDPPSIHSASRESP